MGIRSEIAKQGDFLFRWRSYLPLIMAVPFLFAAQEIDWETTHHSLHGVWECVCLGVSFLGLFVRAFVIGFAPQGTSGRNTSHQVAEVLNTTGIYATVRHPLYLGNYLIGLGPSLFISVWWFPILYTLAFALYYERIMAAEERFLSLKFGEAYSSWASVTPAIIPSLKQWTKPSLNFSFKNVLRREYTAFAQIAVTFFLVELMEHWMVDHRLVIEAFWLTLAIVGGGQYIIFRHLKRQTCLLNVEGR